jgi:hypothetical protein
MPPVGLLPAPFGSEVAVGRLEDRRQVDETLAEATAPSGAATSRPNDHDLTIGGNVANDTSARLPIWPSAGARSATLSGGPLRHVWSGLLRVRAGRIQPAKIN